MSDHDDRISLRHMLSHAREAVEFSTGRARQDLATDRQLFLVLMKLVEIVGEGASRVSQEFRNSHPEIPWSFAIGMRARLSHGYDKVDLDILWETVTEDLPELIETLERLVGE